MPNHVYQPLRNPARWPDRMLVHPTDTAVAFLAVMMGTMIAVSLFVTDLVPSKSMDRMPEFIIVLVALFLGLGGGIALTGLNWWGDNVSTGWALERFGWLLVTGGLLTYGISVAWHYTDSVFSWLVPLILGAGSLLRALSILLIERGVRSTLSRLPGATHE